MISPIQFHWDYIAYIVITAVALSGVACSLVGAFEKNRAEVPWVCLRLTVLIGFTAIVVCCCTFLIDRSPQRYTLPPATRPQAPSDSSNPSL